MPRVFSFPPLADDDAETLILGSMPGAASLAAGRYYAHPRNAFWPIIDQLLGLPPGADYGSRTAALLAAKIALWDVLQSCRRDGSLDTDIAPESEIANDLPGFFAAHPKIVRVGFNGGKAESTFRRHVLPKIDASRFALIRLPSTSPAHAALRPADKLTVWRTALDPLPETTP